MFSVFYFFLKKIKNYFKTCYQSGPLNWALRLLLRMGDALISWGCLVGEFKQQFLVFKQHYTYFHLLFHRHIFSKNTNNLTRTTLPNGLISLINLGLSLAFGVQFSVEIGGLILICFSVRTILD